MQQQYPYNTVNDCRAYLFDSDQKIKLEELARQSKIGIEIGTWCGGSASVQLLANPELSLYCVDSWQHMYADDGSEELEFDDNMKRLGLTDRIVKVKGDYRNKSIADVIPDLCADYLYIDGDHSKEGTLEAVLLYRKKLKPNGLILFDDYHDNWKGVIQAVEELITMNQIRDGYQVGKNAYIASVNHIIDEIIPVFDEKEDDSAIELPIKSRRGRKKKQ